MATPAGPLPAHPAPAEEFDPVVFWIRNKGRILLLLAVVAVAGALSLLFWQLKEHSRVKSEAALRGANTPEALQKVASDYPGSIAGGNALLTLAEKQRSEGKLDESTATLKDYLSKFSKHPLISGAYTSLATNYEQQGKLDEALTNYKEVLATYPLSFSAPYAQVAEARILLAQGKADQARTLLEGAMTQFPQSPFREEAMEQLQKLK